MEKIKPYLLPVLILLTGAAVLILDLCPWFTPQCSAVKGRKAMERKDYGKAIKDFSKALSYCETDVNARLHLGEAYQNYGWNDDALAQYDSTWKVCALNGSRASCNAGRIWILKKKPEKAVECFRQALTLTPEADGIWFELGRVLEFLNQNFSAQAAYRQASLLKPKNRAYKKALIELRNKVETRVEPKR